MKLVLSSFIITCKTFHFTPVYSLNMLWSYNVCIRVKPEQTNTKKSPHKEEHLNKTHNKQNKKTKQQHSHFVFNDIQIWLRIWNQILLWFLRATIFWKVLRKACFCSFFPFYSFYSSYRLVSCYHYLE